MQSDELFLHETTKKLVDAFVAAPKHGLLLSGLTGSGLGTLALHVARGLVGHTTDIVRVNPDEKGTISIERVRNLYVETRGVHTGKQVVVVDDVDAMSLDAQNAFLKLLEEPNDNVYFILTSHRLEVLLATVVSRVHHISVRPISDTESQTLLRRLHVTDATALQQMLFLASGLPAELTRLAKDQSYFAEKAAAVRVARDFLSSHLYQRLVLVSKLTDRTEAQAFVAVLAKLLEFSSKKDPSALYAGAATALEQTAKRLSGNGHVRTQLMNLAFRV